MRSRPFALALVATSLAFACSSDPANEDDTGTLSPSHCEYELAPERAPGPPKSAAAVRAGVAEARLDMPVGTPLGGYTARVTLLGGDTPDNRKSPYVTAFVPSTGVQSRPLARALYLEAGDDPVFLIKADVCAAFDRLVYDLESALGADGSMRGRVILSTSHTHSGWAGYQGVPHLMLGFDVFKEDQYQRMLASLVAAAKEAREKAAPAKLGIGIWDGWDPKDEIFEDRRVDDDKLPWPDGRPAGKHKDDRLTVIRVDSEADEPLALLMHFPIHGTVGGAENSLASIEATGHVELAVEDRFDKPVMVMHLQGPAGDISPAGKPQLTTCDKKKKMLCTDYAQMESIGALAAPRIHALWKATSTAREAELEVATRTVPVGRAITAREGALRYAPFREGTTVDSSPDAMYTPDGQIRSPITQFNVQHAAGLCGSDKASIGVGGIKGASGVPYGSCSEVGPVLDSIGGILGLSPVVVPECETTRTTLTALRVSGVQVTRGAPGGASPASSKEDLLFVTLPGEPVTRIAEAIRTKSPAGFDKTFVLGFAQGHIGYLLTAEDWLTGGYEASINIYGPIEGEYLMERALEVADVAWTPERENPEIGKDGKRFDRLVFPRGGTTDAPTTTIAEKAGSPADEIPRGLFVRSREVPQGAEPAEKVARVAGRATFVFFGGSPGDGTPEVVLEREEGGAFAPVRRRNGRLVDGRGGDFILTYTPQEVAAAAANVKRHLWAVEWQAIGWVRDAEREGLDAALSVPEGRYRIAVRGRAAGADYQLASRPFEVVADGAVRLTAERSGAQIAGKVAYPVGHGYRLVRLAGPSDGDVPVEGKLKVKVTRKADGTTRDLEATADAAGAFTVTAEGFDFTGGATVVAEDVYGNRGTLELP
jgi:neutral ceramidase